MKKRWHLVRGTFFFRDQGADGGRIAKRQDDQDILEVEAVCLSDYLNKGVDFLKLDIEGNEIEVLEEASSKLSSVKRIFVEYHSYYYEEQKLEKLLSILKQAGFRYYIKTAFVSENPFLEIKKHFGYDLQLNIWGVRLEERVNGSILG